MAGRYGIAFLNSTKVVGAHRAMLIAHGHTVGDQDVVMHRCDNPICVNPEHLNIGSQTDNLADMCRKGRHTPSIKVSREWRQKIRDQMKHIPTRVLAEQFGVSEKTIRNIRRGL